MKIDQQTAIESMKFTAGVRRHTWQVNNWSHIFYIITAKNFNTALSITWLSMEMYDLVAGITFTA